MTTCIFECGRRGRGPADQVACEQGSALMTQSPRLVRTRTSWLWAWSGFLPWYSFCVFPHTTSITSWPAHRSKVSVCEDVLAPLFAQQSVSLLNGASLIVSTMLDHSADFAGRRTSWHVLTTDEGLERYVEDCTTLCTPRTKDQTSCVFK